MGVVVHYRNWLPGGEVSAVRDLDFPTRRVSVQQVIERRVARELEARRAQKPGALMPDEGSVVAETRRALDAFRRGRLVVLSPQRQLAELSEVIELAAGEELTFLQLRPLASG